MIANTRHSLTGNVRVAFLLSVASVLAATGLFAEDWQEHPSMPQRLANNAVTAHTFGDTTWVYSFMGIDTTKVWSGITRDAMRFNTTSGEWEELPPVPGSVGRIAALAAGLGEKVYVLGGYAVAQNGFETTWASVDIFDPASKTWSAGAPIPTPVDDQVGGVWADSLVYLVSGWSQSQNVQNVQIYDPELDDWTQANPVPFPGTFGGAGGVVGDRIVYADGVNNAFALVNAVHVGEINPADPTEVSWTSLGAHPGPAGYRMAAGPLPGPEDRIYFHGGTDNAYNFDGIGYNTIPSEPLAWTWAYIVPNGVLVPHLDKPVATMDHRAFAAAGDRLYVAGGMESGQAVTDAVWSFSPDVALSTPEIEVAEIPRLTSAPNPARTRARLRLSRDGAGVIKDAVILDTSGRVVRRFEESELARPTGFDWDLTDGRGSRVSPGVYWLAGRVFGRNLSRKIVVVG